MYALGWYTTEERLQARFQEYEAQFIELYIVTKDWNEQTGDKFGKCVHDFALTAWCLLLLITLTFRLVFDPRIMRQMDKIFCFFISNKRVNTLEVLKQGDIASIIQAGKQCLRITDDEDHTLKWYRFGPRD